MKKALYFGILMLVSASLCSCNGINKASSSENPDKAAVQAVSESEEKSYQEFTEEFIGYVNSSDIEGQCRMMYPEKIFEGFKKSGELEGYSYEHFVYDLNPDPAMDEIISVTKVGKAEEQDTEMLLSNYDGLNYVMELEAEYNCGEEGIPVEKFSELNSGMPIYEEHKFNMTDCFEVKVEYVKNGENDYDYFYIINLEGEGMKIMPTFKKYTGQ